MPGLKLLLTTEEASDHEGFATARKQAPEN